MSDLSRQEREKLLRVARSAIAAALGAADQMEKPDSPTPALLRPQGCFVTLQKGGALRGCIGMLEARSSLLEAVEESAKNAAFHDPRFSPLTKEELEQVDIEISRLTVPEDLHFETPDDLLEKLKPGEHGVILGIGYRRATFLPQVWEQVPDKRLFLEHLCRKAGMGRNCWKEKGLSVQVYRVEHFSEKDL
ncbi:MAG: AmmeMemoRadiSam system protein A [Desulfobacterales bacterium]|jgi:AmmeMemoRadiSam system protein A